MHIEILTRPPDVSSVPQPVVPQVFPVDTLRIVKNATTSRADVYVKATGPFEAMSLTRTYEAYSTVLARLATLSSSVYFAPASGTDVTSANSAYADDVAAMS